ncbi:MAG: DUF1522 domain-containing protein [Ancalomicrobiaceae bacterium]|nr:DUF1522 domain-containing protein [Ancalomicrobiaceae bacterium]
MSSIVLSSAVRSNLLALQNTASLIATTQNRLATGKSVNSALDNPTNFFTAAGLDNRASDINNLLDGISNGVQVLQSANTGITSLQSLINSAKSIANQALQTSIGYSTKSNVSTTISGANSSDLRGTATYGNATATSNILDSGAAGGATPITGSTSLGGIAGLLSGTALTGASTANITSTTSLSSLGITAGSIAGANGTVTLAASGGNSVGSGSTINNSNIDISVATVGDLVNALNRADATPSYSATAATSWSAANGVVSDSATGTTTYTNNGIASTVASTQTGSELLKALGFDTTTVPGSPTRATGASVAGLALAAPATADGNTLVKDLNGVSFADGETLSSTGGSITFSTTGANTATTININTATVNQLITAFNAASGQTFALGTGANAGELTVDGAADTVFTVGGTGTPADLSGLQGTAGGTSTITYTHGAYTATALETSVATATTKLTDLSSTGVAGGAAIALDASSIKGAVGTVRFDSTNVSTTATSVVGTGTGVNNTTLGANATVADLLSALNLADGSQTKTIPVTSTWSESAGVLTDSASSNLTATTTNALTALGWTSGVQSAGTSGTAVTSATTPADTGATTLASLTGSNVAAGDTLSVNGKTITFASGAAPTASATHTGVNGNIETDGNGNSTVYLGSATIADVLNAVDLASGVQTATLSSSGASLAGSGSSVNASGQVVLKSSTSADLSVTGKADLLHALGLTSSVGSGDTTLTAARTTATSTLGALIKAGSTLNVDGKTITFASGTAPTASASHTGVVGGIETDGAGNSTVYLGSSTVSDVLSAIDLATGVKTASLSSSGASLSTASGLTPSSVQSNGQLQLDTGIAKDLNITGTGNALSALGLTGNQGTALSFNASRTATTDTLDGKTLSITSFNGGTAVNVTFGDGTNGTVKSLDQLNSALQANNMTATLDASGKLTISASNDYASSTLGGTEGGVISGTATDALSFTAASAPVADANSQTTRASLVSQFNTILGNIDSTAADSSYNGVNLLAGDQLQLTFDETGKSKLSITGVTFNASGLGLSSLSSGTDFVDNASTNNVLSALNTAANTLRSQAAAFGSNLSVVQTRQDFNKNLVNVLQTGSSNLTSADMNEEAANSQALQTRQSLSVSALSLANQAQQSVLQLLR